MRLWPKLLLPVVLLCAPAAQAASPNAFSFIARSNVATHVFVTSEARKLEGFEGSLPVTVSGGQNAQYSIDGGAFTAAAGSVVAGQTLTVRHLSSSSASICQETLVRVGDGSSRFASTTGSADRSPNVFSLGQKSYVAAGTMVESATFVPSGYNSSVTVTPSSNAEYRIDAGPYTTAKGTLLPGQSVTVRHLASSTKLQYTRSTLKVGDVTATFTSRSEGLVSETPPPDADSDGVPDSSDACANTPQGTSVEPTGCAAASNCAASSYTLGVSRSGDGTVTSSPAGIDCGADCGESFPAGSSVSLTATAAPGYRFVGWTGACTGSGACVVTMDAAKTVTASFELIPSYRLSVSLGGTGTGNVASNPAGIACGADCSEDYLDQTVVLLTATPTNGSTFNGWSAPCGSAGPCMVTMDAAKTVTASFTAAIMASCNAQDDLMVSAAPLPGPAVMRLAPPDAPILQNRNARFTAAPLMVSGHEQYANGEYAYQDYVFDDFGAETSGSPYTTATITSPATGNATPDAANYRSGDISYPSNIARFGENAADLVELRIAPGSSDIAYRVTLNTLLAKDTTLVGIAWNKDANTSGGSSTLVPTGATTVANGNHGALGATLPGTDEVIWLWNNAAGVGGQHVAFNATGGGVVTALTVTVDLEANQMTVLVPRAVHSPSGTAWKYVLFSGLHDGNGTWLRPTQNASATLPGGSAFASSNPPPIFDLNNHYAIANGQTGGKTGELCHYLDTPCDTVQGIALRQVNGTAAPALTAFARAVDFDALATNVARNTVPADGAANPDKKSLVRIFASRIVTTPAEGHERGPDQGTAGASGNGLYGVPTSDRVFFYGPLQSYSLYVPTGYRRGTAAPLTWSNHSLAQFHQQYNGTRFVQEVGEKRGSLVATPNSRSTDGFYVGRNEIDHFEVWADILRNYSVDERRTAMTGYSMGGHATYRLATLYPDLFTKAYSVVGPPGAGIWKGTGGVGSGVDANRAEEYYTLTNYWLENTRNIPFFNQVMYTDYLVPYQGPRQQNIGSTAAGDQSFEALGYRYTFQEFQTGEHLTLFANDSYPLVKDYLGSEAQDPNPRRVTFSYVPDADYNLPASSDGTPVRLSHDKAYWVSNLVLRNAADGPAPISKSAKGTVDVQSLAFGRADALAAAQTTTPGTLTGGYVSPALAYTQWQKTWAPPLVTPVENRLLLTLTNLSAVHLDGTRAALNPAMPITVSSTSDGVSTLNLSGNFTGYRGYTVTEDGAPLCTAKVGPTGARVPVKSGTHTYRIVPGL